MITSTIHGIAKLHSTDVLIASSPPFFPHLAGLVISKIRRIPLVLELRDLWPDYLVGMGLLPRNHFATRALFALERALLRRADHVVVVTESFKRRVIEKGVAPECVTVIPNGVDLELYFRESNPDPPLDSLSRKPGRFIVGYLGTFGVGQNLESVVDAAALLAKNNESIHFVLVGDGLERQRVEARARQPLLSNVSFHSPIDRAVTRAFYNSCDACLVPLAPVDIFQETIPSKMFEIMACERPVIACLRGEGKRIVEASRGGIVAEPGNPSSIASAILSLRDQTIAQRNEMGRAGRQYVRDHYQRQVLADCYLRVLRTWAN